MKLGGSSTRAVASGLVLLLTGVCAAAQGTITLKPVARLEAGAAVTIADVADLTGPEALALADVRLDAQRLPVRDGSAVVDVERVREILNERKDVHWGRLTLAGRSCVVRHVQREAPAAEATPAEADPTLRPEHVEPGTVRAMLAEKIAEMLRAGPDRLRLTFDQNDREVLDLATAGRVVEAQPTGSSDRMTLDVKVFEGERMLTRAAVRVDVRVKRPVLVVRQGISRGQKIGPDDFSLDDQWLALKARPASAAGVVGAIARSSIRAGKVLDETDFEPETIVRKGELVTVHCLAGLVRVETVARAMSAGKDGEVINFQAQDDSKRTFQARMSGRGRAVAVAAGTPGLPAAAGEAGLNDSGINTGEQR